MTMFALTKHDTFEHLIFQLLLFVYILIFFSFFISNENDTYREAFKKKVYHFLHCGGGSGPVFVTLFFQKHGLKWLNIAL